MQQPINNEIYSLSDYMDPSPYPNLAVNGRNQRYAQLLMEDYAGLSSEFSAVCQYTYQHLVLQREKDVAETLHKIAIVEMMHMDKLGKVIFLLGEDPQFSAGGRSWSGNDVMYGNCLGQCLHYDLASEYGAIEGYKKHIMQIGDENIKALLRRIIRDEEVHVSLIQEMIQNSGV